MITCPECKESMVSYILDVSNAVVRVFQYKNYWRWSFSWTGKSVRINNTFWNSTEKGAKKEAKKKYIRVTKQCPTRIRWLKEAKP